jgi:hypothetical protein
LVKEGVVTGKILYTEFSRDPNVCIYANMSSGMLVSLILFDAELLHLLF